MLSQSLPGPVASCFLLLREIDGRHGDPGITPLTKEFECVRLSDGKEWAWLVFRQALLLVPNGALTVCEYK